MSGNRRCKDLTGLALPVNQKKARRTTPVFSPLSAKLPFELIDVEQQLYIRYSVHERITQTRCSLVIIKFSARFQERQKQRAAGWSSLLQSKTATEEPSYVPMSTYPSHSLASVLVSQSSLKPASACLSYFIPKSFFLVSRENARARKCIRGISLHGHGNY